MFSNGVDTMPKLARELLVGDYLEVTRDRFTADPRGPDEGYHRVEHVYLLDVKAARTCFRGEWMTYPDDVITVVYCHGIISPLFLREGDVRVLVDVNPEREAGDKREPWHADPEDLPLLPAGARLRSQAELDYLQHQDQQRRPPPRDDPQEPYASVFVDDPPEARLLHLHGVDGMRVIPTNRLPWPHRPDDCRHAARFDEIHATYPKDLDDLADRKELRRHSTGQAASAELFTQLTPGDFAACRYHQADWAIIGRLALQRLAHETERAGERFQPSPDLGEAERRLLDTLFHQSIRWDELDTHLVDGQHRLCALRAAGVPACPVVGRYFPDPPAEPEPGASESPVEHARRTVADFWTWYATRRYRPRRARRLIPQLVNNPAIRPH